MSNFPLAYKLSWLPRFLSSSARMPESFERQPLQGPAPEGGGRPTSVNLLFFGDISNVANSTIAAAPDDVRELFRRADLVIGNCETPVTRSAAPGLTQRLGLRHRADTGFIDGFLDAFGLSADKLILSLANNHALDCGVEGLRETVSILRKRGITVIGCRDAGEPPLTAIEQRGLRLGFAASTEWINRDPETARDNIWFGHGLHRIDWSGLKREHRLDTLVALPHWDFEFRHFPQPATRALAAQLARGGVDLIVGQHPHVLQPLERHGEGLCAYSLGDVLGTAFRRTTWPARLFGLLEIEVRTGRAQRGDIRHYRLHPRVRTHRGGREEIKTLSELRGGLRDKIERRLRLIFPEH